MGMWDWKSRASVALLMRQQDHDATGLRTLDVSGNVRHAAWTAGATAPTKLTGRHGYDFDGGDYMIATLNGAFNTPGITFAVEFEADYALADGADHVFWDTDGAARFLCYKTSANALSVTMNGAGYSAALGVVSPYWFGTGTNRLVVAGKSGKNMLWLNGGLLSDNVTAWAAGNPVTMWLGTSNGLGAKHDGRITRFASWPFYMPQMELEDLDAYWQQLAGEI